MEWYEALHPYLMFSAKIRRWFMETVFCQHKERFSEFLLECPSTEVCSYQCILDVQLSTLPALIRFEVFLPRWSHSSAGCPTKILSLKWKSLQMLEWVCANFDFMKLLLNLRVVSSPIEKAMHQFSEIALNNLLQLLKKEVSDHSRHLNQYFQVFLNYANKGPYEVCTIIKNWHLLWMLTMQHPTTVVQRQQLIRLGVPSLFIAVSLDEGPGPPMRSPYTDLTKLYATVGILVRCCNVTLLQKSLHQVMWLMCYREVTV